MFLYAFTECVCGNLETKSTSYIYITDAMLLLTLNLHELGMGGKAKLTITFSLTFFQCIHFLCNPIPESVYLETFNHVTCCLQSCNVQLNDARD